MIAIIEIPHQRKARLHWYVDEAAVVADASDQSEHAGDDYPDTFGEAIKYLADDLNRQMVVSTTADVADVEAYA